METNDTGNNPFRPVAKLVQRHLPGSGPELEEQDRIGFLRLQSRLRNERQRPAALAWFWEGRRGPVLLTLAGATMMVLGVTTWQGQRPLTYQVRAGSEGTTGVIVAPTAAPSAVVFSDGTDLELEPRARGRIAALDRRGARVILEEGRARVKVAKRPRARWTFQAGPYTVLVTGTAFDFRWSERTKSFDLQLYSGSVIVHGPAAGENGKALRAGQQIRATASRRDMLIEPIQKVGAVAVAPPAPAVGVAPAPAEAAPAEAAPAPAPAEARGTRRPTLLTWNQRVGAGDQAGVLRDAKRRGLPKLLAHGSSDDLAALADAARYSHRRDLARQVLLAQRRRFPGSYDAEVAAFHLGRLAEDFGKNARQALVWYETYLTEAPSGTWALEALRRKMIVQQKVEGRARACETAKEILRRQPDGPHAEVARELCPADRP